jgi:hypothetical protein
VGEARPNGRTSDRPIRRRVFKSTIATFTTSSSGHVPIIIMACRSVVAPLLRTSAIRPSARALPAIAVRGIRSSAPAFRPDAPKTSIPPFEETVGFNPASRTNELSTPLHEYGQYLTTCLPKFVQQFSVYKDELTLYTAPSGIIPVITFLRDHHQCQYKSVMDITAVDVPTRSQRFEVSSVLSAFRHAANPLPFAGRLPHAVIPPQPPNPSKDICRRNHASSIPYRSLPWRRLVRA